MSVLPLERRRTTVANILLLFCVSIEPFLFSLFQGPVAGAETSSFLNTATALFALDVGGMMLVLGLFCNEIATKDRKLVSSDLIDPFKNERNSWLLSAAIFFVSAVPIFWSLQLNGTAIRYLIWIIPLVLVWVERISRKG